MIDVIEIVAATIMFAAMLIGAIREHRGKVRGVATLTLVVALALAVIVTCALAQGRTGWALLLSLLGLGSLALAVLERRKYGTW